METVYNRPKQMNCQDLEMQSKMLSLFKFWQENPDQVPKYMLIYGAGDKAFTAGGDIKFITQEVKTQELWHRFYVTFYYVMREYSKMQKPFRIAIYNGITIGAGTGYTITGPIRIATEKTVFSMPEVSVGYLADSGCTYYFPRICGNALGMHLGVTGMKVYGKDLVKYGLATHFIDSQNVEKLKQDLLHNLQANTPESEAFRIVEKYNIPIEDKTIENMNQIEEIYQYDSYQEAYKRLMRSNTKFAQSIKDLMKKETHSPLSHALIYELIQKGITQTHEECLFNEYRAQMAFWDSNEFREGTRAKLVDRDNNPNWQHKSVISNTRLISLLES
eukprot:403345907